LLTVLKARIRVRRTDAIVRQQRWLYIRLPLRKEPRRCSQGGVVVKRLGAEEEVLANKSELATNACPARAAVAVPQARVRGRALRCLYERLAREVGVIDEVDRPVDRERARTRLAPKL
jgi:hypothetical protein